MKTKPPINPASLLKHKTKLGSSRDIPNPKKRRGHSFWIEHGFWFEAPTVSAKKFGPHQYDGYHGPSRAGCGPCHCGCWMASSASGGMVDPFGPCPLNPKRKTESSPHRKGKALMRAAVAKVEVQHSGPSDSPVSGWDTQAVKAAIRKAEALSPCRMRDRIVLGAVLDLIEMVRDPRDGPRDRLLARASSAINSAMNQ